MGGSTRLGRRNLHRAIGALLDRDLVACPTDGEVEVTDAGRVALEEDGHA